ncbi:MAG: BrnA antitoxin family protein [Deltaproteobacteria bacterium]|nr:BrnA antitoxin family protein [Deltaproteobacteria bacterium]MBW2420066.1 BrnA antitoxin family protein [Deltaproteobacteria bacterium]
MSNRPRPVQYFSDEYLEQCRRMSPEEILAFLESFRKLQAAKPAKSKLISLKVREDLLEAFKHKAKASGLRYQTQIKQLMSDWVHAQP